MVVRPLWSWSVSSISKRNQKSKKGSSTTSKASISQSTGRKPTKSRMEKISYHYIRYSKALKSGRASIRISRGPCPMQLFKKSWESRIAWFGTLTRQRSTTSRLPKDRPLKSRCCIMVPGRLTRIEFTARREDSTWDSVLEECGAKQTISLWMHRTLMAITILPTMLSRCSMRGLWLATPSSASRIVP